MDVDCFTSLAAEGWGGYLGDHHIALDIPVAVKILHAHLAEKDPVIYQALHPRGHVQRQKLQHPNVVGVMNVGFENGLHYIVMPFVGGGSAAARLAKQGRLPLSKVMEIAIDIAHALHSG